MKALYFTQTGDPAVVLALGDFAVPQPKENEVLIKILAAPVNPADFLFIKGQYRLQPTFPQIAGLEGTGLVIKAGDNVSIREGELVSFRAKNASAEYVVVPADKLYRLPPDFGVEKAAQFSLNAVTAWGLLEEAKLEEGSWLLLTAGNSAVSKLVIQLARQRKLKVIATVRSNEQAPELYELGADVVINTEIKLLSEEVLRIAGGRGVQAALDAVGGSLGIEIIKSASAGANIILYGLLSEDLVCFHNADIILKLLTIKGFGLDNWLSGIDTVDKSYMIEKLVSVIKEPGLKMPVATKFSLDNFQQALINSTANQMKGKTLFTPA